MPFPYYDNLSAAKKRIYRKSDAIESVPLKNAGDIHSAIRDLKASLEKNKRRDVAKHASEICRLICEGLGVDVLIVRIKSRRPSSSAEELQGLYERTEGEQAVLTVWMKTAAKGQVVAFKSFLRTILHELCHHIDYAYFGLKDSLHTEGFFKREASIYRQIVPVELQKREPRKERAARAKKDPPAKKDRSAKKVPRPGKAPPMKTATKKIKEAEQMDLF
jgi:hypothetical protein